MEQLRQRVIASCHLGPLNETETRNYIEHRLRVVGWNGSLPGFDEIAYAAIHRYTGGVPRRVNVFCDRLLLYGFLEERQMFAEADIEAVGTELLREQEQPATSKKPLGSGEIGCCASAMPWNSACWSWSRPWRPCCSIRNGRTRRWNAWSGASSSWSRWCG